MRYLVLTLALTGCAAAPQDTGEYSWTHPSADRAQFESDQSTCAYETEKATAGYSPSYTPPTIYGAIAAREQNTEILVRKINLMDACMRTRGYTWQRVK